MSRRVAIVSARALSVGSWPPANHAPLHVREQKATTRLMVVQEYDDGPRLASRPA